MMSAIFTYSEARQNLASLLEKALQEGEVRVRRKDGQIFVIVPEVTHGSPLDVEGEPGGAVSADLRLPGDGEEAPDASPQARVGRRVGAGRAADGALVDLQDPVEPVGAAHLPVLSRPVSRPMELPGQQTIELEMSQWEATIGWTWSY